MSPGEADKAVELIDAALAAEGALTRAQLDDVIRPAGIRTEGQALVHILARASVRGLIVRGPVIGRQHAFVRVRDWLGRVPARFSAGQVRSRRGPGRAGPSLPGRTCPGRAIVTWPSGRAFRCATRGAA